jgi:hypothetical protein
MKAMRSQVVCRSGKLVKEGANDIDVMVHSHLCGCNPWLCAVIEDGSTSVIGGDTGGVELMFRDQVDKHPGYVVTERRDVTIVQHE